jgi:hypothetical protein
MTDEPVEMLVRRLTDRSAAQPAGSFPVDPAEADHPGLYAWWADDDGLATLSTAFGTPLPPLIYAGQAGATSSKSGTERAATLRSRIGGNHLRGNVSSSTFRKTLTAVLRQPLDLAVNDRGRLERDANARVSEWMRTHLSIVIAPVDDRATLAAVETAVLHRLDPPLNLMGMPPTPVRKRLSQLRGELRELRIATEG